MRTGWCDVGEAKFGPSVSIAAGTPESLASGVLQLRAKHLASALQKPAGLIRSPEERRFGYAD